MGCVDYILTVGGVVIAMLIVVVDLLAFGADVTTVPFVPHQRQLTE